MLMALGASRMFGIVLPLQLADRTIYERRYRTVFHFVYADQRASGAARNAVLFMAKDMKKALKWK